MATEFVWPATLPQVPMQDDWSVSFESPVMETEMDAGPKKRRLKYSKGMELLSIGYTIDLEELVRWKDFLKKIAYGTTSFMWPDPRVGKKIRVSIKPGTIKEDSTGMYTHLTFTLEAW